MHIDKFLTIPFKDGGRDFNGCDCFGLIYLLYKEYGMNLKDYKISCEETSRINEEINMQKYIWEPISSPKPPCILTLRLDTNPSFVNHVGFVFKENYFIHTTKNSGVTVNRLDSPLWKRKIEGFYIPTEGVFEA